MTPALDALLTLAPVTFEAGRIVGIDGPAGCGKTTAVTALVERLGKPAVSVSLDPRSTDKNVVALFHEAVLGQPAAPRALRTDMLASLRRALAGTEKLIVVDEAQHAGVSALEMIRMLHMDPTAKWDLVLSGADLYKHLSAECMLRTRVMQWANFTPLTPDELPLILSQVHPLFKALDPDLLVRADAAGGGGVLRHWISALGFLVPLQHNGIHIGRKELEQVLGLVLARTIRIPR